MGDRYTFGMDQEEDKLNNAISDVESVFDSIVDDKTFQGADTGLILSYPNTIINSLKKMVEIKKILDEWDNTFCEAEDDFDYLCKIENVIRTNESKNNNGWIELNKEIPPTGIDVLVCDIDGDITITHHTFEKRFINDMGDKVKDVIAWQSLPKPYEKG